MTDENFDIAIIGGSFAGMSAALALANISPQIKIAVIEKQNIVTHNRKADGRGYAISNQSLKLFSEIGVKEAILKGCGIIENIKITDHKCPIVLDFLSKEINEKNFGALIESHIIHNALRDKLLLAENIKLFCPHFYGDINFSNDEVKIAVKPCNSNDDGFIIKSKIMLACDGRFSTLRKIFNIYTIKKNYQQTAIVFNIWHEKAHENIAWEKFLPSGSLAILPLRNQHESSIVLIVLTQDAQSLLDLDDENFLHYLCYKKMENCLDGIKLISSKFSYPLIMVEAQKLYHEKMLLVGDAACGVHPIAGQGLNLGLQNIKILQELIAKYFLCGLDISSFSLREEYNNLARKNARKMVIATDLLNSLFETKSLSIGLARDFGLGVVSRIKFLKKFFIKNAGA